MNDNVTVFYSDEKDSLIASKTLNYWINNGLNGSRKQNIRVDSPNDSTYIIQLIFSDTNNFRAQLSFMDLKKLHDLKNDLNNSVFKKYHLFFSLCDNSFHELMNLD